MAFSSLVSAASVLYVTDNNGCGDVDDKENIDVDDDVIIMMMVILLVVIVKVVVD